MIITDSDFLRRRHGGNYKSVANGEIYNFAYEEELKVRGQTFFYELSDYDFLKEFDNRLTQKGLRNELKCLDNTEEGTGFWKNFNDYALNTHLNTILRATTWRGYIKKGKESGEEKPHHDDMLRCIYLLAHLHKANPSYIKELAELGCIWSVDFRVYYPRKDLSFCVEYGGYLAELYSNILFRQTPSIRKVLKHLDRIIDKLVEHADQPKIDQLLRGRSEDNDSPSLLILKYNQVASVTHFEALNVFLSKQITRDFSPSSSHDLEVLERELFGSQIVASYNDYKLVAALCVRLFVGRPVLPDKETIDFCVIVYNALSADVISGLYFESDGTKFGKKDTSLSSAVKSLAGQNCKSVKAILGSDMLDFSGVPEIYSSYLRNRAEFAIYSVKCPGKEKEKIKFMESNPKIQKVIDYIWGNNLNKINEDVELIDSFIAGDFIYEYYLRDLPER